MPAKNRIKMYEADQFYHLYNRGVAKQRVFLDEQDFAVWMSYLRTYLLPKDVNALQRILASDSTSYKDKDTAKKLIRMNNFSDSLSLHAYCLLPNHFHFLVYQKEENTIDSFMNSLGTRYAMYFNKKYKRVGPLFQGVYRAVPVTSGEQLLYLTKYIHRNPNPEHGSGIDTYPYSSYATYLGRRVESYVGYREILSMSRLKPAAYRAFVTNTKDDGVMLQSLYSLISDF